MNDKKDDLIKKLESNIPQKIIPASTPVDASKKEVQDDYEFSRKTYKDLVEKSNTAIDSMLELAMQSEHPRAFEVLSSMLKNTADMADKLMDLQKKTKEVKSEQAPTSGGGTTNNNLFVGTTTQLQKFLQNKLKNVTPENEVEPT